MFICLDSLFTWLNLVGLVGGLRAILRWDLDINLSLCVRERVRILVNNPKTDWNLTKVQRLNFKCSNQLAEYEYIRLREDGGGQSS